MAYKHAEVVKAWLDGKVVQILINGQWIDYQSGEHAPRNELNVVPSFIRVNEFRIKPNSVFVKTRRYLYKNADNDYAIYTVCNKSQEETSPRYGGFVKWLDPEWVETEVEL